MATRNFVPRADGEGSIGTAAKNWLSGYFKQLNVANVTVDDSKVPTTDTTDLTMLLNNLATMIKQNKGTSGWKDIPATNLATLATLVGNLASGSDVTWEGNKFTNAKLGITGLMDENGYICFGPNCGNLIIQWGFFPAKSGMYQVNFPITFTNSCYSILVGTNDSDTGGIYNIHAAGYTLSAFYYVFTYGAQKDARYIAFGKGCVKSFV